MTRRPVPVLAFAVVALLLAALPASFASADDEVPTASATSSPPVTVIIPQLSPTPTSTSGNNGNGNGGGTGGGNNGGGNNGNGNGGGKNPDGSPIPPGNPGKNKPGLKLDRDVLAANDFMIASGTGYTPGEKVQLVLYPGTVIVGSKTADAAGAISMRFRMPKDTATGGHVAEATGWDSAYVANEEFTVSSSVDAGGIPWPWWLLLGAIAFAIVSSLVLFVRARTGRGGSVS